MGSLWRAIVGASCGLVLLSPLAFGQGSTAQINGTVRDASGGVLPGATVTATRTDTGFTRNVVTDSAGTPGCASGSPPETSRGGPERSALVHIRLSRSAPGCRSG